MGPKRKNKTDFNKDCCKRTRGSDFKLKEGKIQRIDIREKIFMIRMEIHGNTLITWRNGICSLPGNIQNQFGSSSRCSWRFPCSQKGELDWKTFNRPFNSNYSRILQKITLLKLTL